MPWRHAVWTETSCLKYSNFKEQFSALKWDIDDPKRPTESWERALEVCWGLIWGLKPVFGSVDMSVLRGSFEKII